MKQVGGYRNFGWGKQMEWAGKQALRAAFDGGHYATVANHGARWRRFCTWAREQGVRDVRQITVSEVAQFAAHLRQQTDRGMSIGYAKNQLTSVNVAMESLRGDRSLWVRPGDFQAEAIVPSLIATKVIGNISSSTDSRSFQVDRIVIRSLVDRATQPINILPRPPRYSTLIPNQEVPRPFMCLSSAAALVWCSVAVIRRDLGGGTVNLELWFAFAIASTVLLLIPNPTILPVVSYAFSRGTESKRRTIPGVVLGDFTAMTISLLGASAIVAASATLLPMLKIIVAFRQCGGPNRWIAKDCQ